MRKGLQRIDFKRGAYKDRILTGTVSCACGWEATDVPFKGADDSHAARRNEAYQAADRLHRHCPLDDIAKKSSISLKKIERAAKKASLGPWFAQECGTSPCWCRVIAQGPNDDIGIVPSGSMGARDAEFVAAANPAVVIRLIARIRKLEKALDEATRVMLSAADVIEGLGEDEEEVEEERERARMLINILKERP